MRTSQQAALELLEDRVCEAATFRYTVSILLRLLPIRWGQSGRQALVEACGPAHGGQWLCS